MDIGNSKNYLGIEGYIEGISSLHTTVLGIQKPFVVGKGSLY